MEKNKNHLKKINLKKIQKNLNIVTFCSIFSVSFLIIIISLIGIFQLRNQNIKLIDEKKEQVFKIYLNDVFQRLLLLSNSTPFLDFLLSGAVSRNELENEMLNNFSHYVNEEITGYQLLDSSLNEIIKVGKITDSFLLLNLCYINNKLNSKLGRCIANLYVFFDKDTIFKKIQKIDPSVSHCSLCTNFGVDNGLIINDFEVIKSSNFKIPFTLKINNYTQTLIFVVISLIIMIIISFLNFYFNIKFLNNYIYLPLNKLYEYIKNDSNRGPFILEEIVDIVDKIDDLKNEIRKNEHKKKQDELTKLAQVAHDIKSPLVALNTFFAKATQLPEDNRILVRNAIQRMQDIANSLILKHQEIYNHNDGKNVTETVEPHSVQLLSSLIDSLISEKRMQYRDHLDIEIEGSFGVNSYGLFSKIQPKEFKRMLSNLINNAVESLNKKGNIILDLYSYKDKIIFSIKDNGIGIHPEILPKLMKRGATYGKVGGSGLGLYHAKKISEQWGGKLELKSEFSIGTQVLLTLPKVYEPSWFVSTLNISLDSTIVIIDDDASIHNIWNERFQLELKPEHNIKIIHFSNPGNVLLWYTRENKLDLDKIIFLCDYEFINHSYNGLDLISKLEIYKQSILVTSRYEEEGFKEKCEKMGIKMIPKNLTCFVPIKVDYFKEKPCAILIDDDLFIHSIWKMSAIDRNIVCYEKYDDFIIEVEKYDVNTPIYIDSHLGNGQKGEEIAKHIFEIGFRDIYLETGYDSNHFPKMDWIKGIIGKAPPWMD